MTLRDIHLPDAVSWWPPAIGWWVLVALILLAIFFLPRLYRYLTYKPLNIISQQAFQEIKEHYKEQQDVMFFIQSLSKLLRQISMSYHGREKVANLTGEQWIHSLNDLTDTKYFNGELSNILTNAPYQHSSNIDPILILEVTQNWVNDLPKNPRVTM